jgi:hypothetical protein
MKLGIYVAPVLLAVASIASAQDVRFNFDKAADFTKYKTFKLVDNKDSDKLDDLTKKQVDDSLVAELTKKGLSRATGDAADLYVAYQASISTEKQVNTFDSGYAYGPGYGGGYYGGYGGWGGGMSTSTTETIYNGTLVVDMYDTATKKLVWRGAASKTLDVKAKPDKREKNLVKAFTKLFKNYPPPLPKK